MQTNKKEASHSSTNWDELKNEYISTKISLRKLSEKHGVPFSTIQKEAKRSGWNQLRNQVEVKQNQMITEQVATTRASNADKAMNIINKLMDKMEKSIAVIKDGDVQSMKQLVGAMKDLRDMGVIDVGEKTQETINITISNDLEDFTK